GLESNPQNFLLMHAMGPNVAGVIGSAVAAGILLAFVSSHSLCGSERARQVTLAGSFISGPRGECPWLTCDLDRKAVGGASRAFCWRRLISRKRSSSSRSG